MSIIIDIFNLLWLNNSMFEKKAPTPSSNDDKTDVFRPAKGSSKVIISRVQKMRLYN